MQVDAMRRFLRDHYTDEQLAAALAHAEDGKLSYFSCCCFTGCSTADHELQEGNSTYIGDHMQRALRLPGAVEAAAEFLMLGWDAENPAQGEVLRRDYAVLLFLEEIERRKKERLHVEEEELEAVLG